MTLSVGAGNSSRGAKSRYFRTFAAQICERISHESVSAGGKTVCSFFFLIFFFNVFTMFVQSVKTAQRQVGSRYSPLHSLLIGRWGGDISFLAVAADISTGPCVLKILALKFLGVSNTPKTFVFSKCIQICLSA